MKTCTYLICVTALISSLTASSEITPPPIDPIPHRGTDYETVIALLGEPEGLIRMGDRTVLYFMRGSVELQSNQVISTELTSSDNAIRQRQSRQRAEQEARVRREAERARRIVEGTEIRDRKLSDPYFVQTSASERVAYWQVFHQRYPEVAIGVEYETALRELQMEQQARAAAMEKEKQIAELQRQVNEAEDRAREAEEKYRDRVYVGYSYYPVIYPVRPSACPPKPCPKKSGVHGNITMGKDPKVHATISIGSTRNYATTTTQYGWFPKLGNSCP